MASKKFDFYTITSSEEIDYLKCAKKELKFIFNDEKYHFSKNVSNKYKKHLGFLTACVRVPKENGSFAFEHRIIIYDYKKLMLFRIKYGL